MVPDVRTAAQRNMSMLTMKRNASTAARRRMEAAVLTVLNENTGTDMGLISVYGVDRLQTEAGVRIVQAGNMRSEIVFFLSYITARNIILL
jgi:hypothetical protein